jgi:hypothetical protein
MAMYEFTEPATIQSAIPGAAERPANAQITAHSLAWWVLKSGLLAALNVQNWMI